MHGCVHTYIHAYMHAYMQTYIHACMHACVYIYIYIYSSAPPRVTSLFLVFTAEWALQLAQNRCVFSIILAHLAHTMLSPIISYAFFQLDRVLVVEAIHAQPCLLKVGFVMHLSWAWLCSFSKMCCKTCLGELVVEAILAQPSVLKGSPVECDCCANSQRHLAKNA